MMREEQPAGEQLPPPHVQLIQMATAYWASRVVYTAAKLGLADKLAGGPKSAAELAGPAGLHGPSLHRFMRTLASLGILNETEGQRFGLTALGEALRSKAPGSAHAAILTLNNPAFASAIDHLIDSLKTGETVFDKLHGSPFFDYLAKRPEEASLFSETMVGIHGAEPPAVAAAYDFPACKIVIDVGGATGNMLAEILLRHKGLHGVLFDLPHVVKDAPQLLSAKGVSDRVTIKGGSFFETAPEGGDAYILSHIIHDWDEAKCLTILAALRKAMKPGARLLLVEMVLPTGNEPHFGKMLDLVMLTIPGGQERTEAEYAALLAKGGFRLERVIPTASAVSIVEAVPS